MSLASFLAVVDGSYTLCRTCRPEKAYRRLPYRPEDPHGTNLASILFVLPKEIRLMIYRCLLVPDPHGLIAAYLFSYSSQCASRHWNVGFRIFPSSKAPEPMAENIHVAILRSCNIIYNEAVSILYGENTFIGNHITDPVFSIVWRQLDLVKWVGIPYMGWMQEDIDVPQHITRVKILAFKPDNTCRERLPGEDEGTWLSRVLLGQLTEKEQKERDQRWKHLRSGRLHDRFQFTEANTELDKFLLHLAELKRRGVRDVDVSDFENEALDRAVKGVLRSPEVADSAQELD